MKNLFILILISLIMISTAFAAGDTGLAFLKIGVGARATAMGEAYVGLSDDPS